MTQIAAVSTALDSCAAATSRASSGRPPTTGALPTPGAAWWGGFRCCGTARAAGAGGRQRRALLLHDGLPRFRRRRADRLDQQLHVPMVEDCKHVVAVLVSARSAIAAAPARRLSRGHSTPPCAGPGPTPARRPWRRCRAPARPGRRCWPRITAECRRAGRREPRVGLLFEVEVRGTARVAIRPVVPGKNGWVKTGIDWSKVESGYAYGRPPARPGQRTALGDIARIYARRQRRYYLSASDRIHLDDLGPGWWAALREVQRHGIPLLTGQKTTGEVVVADDPAGLVADVCRPEPGRRRVAHRRGRAAGPGGRATRRRAQPDRHSAARSAGATRGRPDSGSLRPAARPGPDAPAAQRAAAHPGRGPGSASSPGMSRPCEASCRSSPPTRASSSRSSAHPGCCCGSRTNQGSRCRWPGRSGMPWVTSW